MQSQFTDKAQNALAQAGRCARGLKQGYIGTEHILVGLLKEDTGVAAKVLADNGVEVDQVMEMIRDLDRKSTRLNSSHRSQPRMPSSA